MLPLWNLLIEAAAADCLHNTGEGGISPFHKKGGKLIWQLGTGYFGARGADGGFCEDKFKATIEQAEGMVKAIEIKFSQGAKPGLGGMLPALKSLLKSLPFGNTSWKRLRQPCLSLSIF